MRRVMRSPHILPANPQKRPLSRDQVARKQEKAVDFLERVVGESELGQTEKTGFELADEIRDLSVEEYADRKGIALENPTEHSLIDQAVSRFLPLAVAREDRRSAIQAARAALEALPENAGEAEKVAAVCGAVSGIADQVREREREEEERQERQAELERRRWHRRWLMEHAKQHISSIYLSRLHSQGEISRDEWLHPDPELLQAVEDGLREELTGSESYQEAQQLAEEIADDFLFGDESEDEEDDEDEEEDEDAADEEGY